MSKIKELLLEGDIEDTILSTDNLVKSKAIFIELEALKKRISKLEAYHQASYDVDGVEQESLYAAINAINGGGKTLTLLKDVSVSKTDSSDQSIPAITNSDVIIDGNGKTLTIDSKVVTEGDGVFSFIPNQLTAVKFKASTNDSGITVKNITFKTTDKTAIYAKHKTVSVENATISGESTSCSYIKMSDGANCTMLSVTAQNETGSILETNAISDAASFYIKGCDFTGSTSAIVETFKNTGNSSEISVVNSFTFDGGNYNNFNYPDLSDNNISVDAKYTGATEEINNESLSAGLSSSFTFNETVPEEFKNKIINKYLYEKPLKWYVQLNELSDGKTYTITYKEPIKIPGLSALLQLRQDVLDGNCHENDRFVQMEDIDMEDLVSPNYIDVAPHGIYWDGIGLRGAGGWGIDTAHTFKGMYDGNGKTIKNLRFANRATGVGLSAGEDKFCGLFRSVQGAYIKDLSVYIGGDISGDTLTTYRDSDNEPCDPSVTCITCNGFDPKLVASGKQYGGATLVGVTLSGCTIENCATFGNIGTLEHPTTHTTGGIMCFNSDGGTGNRLSSEYVLSNVINNANVFSTRKAGGICAYPMCIHRYTNVTNNGTVMKTTSSKEYQDDAVGGIFGYADHNQAASVPSYQFTNVKNTGIISADELLLKSSRWLGQYAGKSMAYHNGYTDTTHFFDNWLSGDMICRADTESFAGNYSGLRMHLYDLDFWYGEFLADDPTMVRLTKPVAGGLYKVMVDNNSALSITITQPNSWGGTDSDTHPSLSSSAARIKLNKGEVIYLDESLVSKDLRGHANVFRGDTAIEGKLSTDAVYCYQA